MKDGFHFADSCSLWAHSFSSVMSRGRGALKVLGIHIADTIYNFTALSNPWGSLFMNKGEALVIVAKVVKAITDHPRASGVQEYE